MYINILKPLLEFVIALILSIVTAPIMLLIAAALWLFNNNQVIFLQKRSGRYGKEFFLLKFKTMFDLVDEEGKLLSDELRLTPIGRFLRSTSLDELPQLINILIGDMNLIGPRPLLPEYNELFNSHHKLRLNIKPGLTGLAQVKGRNLLAWNEKLNLDVKYVDEISIGLDAKILLMTIIAVFSAKGINTSAGSTMPKFAGY